VFGIKGQFSATDMNGHAAIDTLSVASIRLNEIATGSAFGQLSGMSQREKEDMARKKSPGNTNADCRSLHSDARGI